MRCAVIIGASSGIGFSLAKLLIAKGYHIGVAARRVERLEELKRLSPDSIEIAGIDVTHRDAPHLLRDLICRLGGMDLFIYAAGIGKVTPCLDEGIEIKTVETNVLGFTLMLGEAYRYMLSNGGGHIAVITSIAGTKGISVSSSYCASKSFQSIYIQACEQLSNMQHSNITFTDIRPGFVNTDLLDHDLHYPMLMNCEDVSRKILNAIEKRRHVVIIDWRWYFFTALWRRIPRWIWRRMNIGQKIR